MKGTFKPSRKGTRHPLLMYRRMMDRVWKYTLVLGLVLAVATRWHLLRERDIFGWSSNIWIFAAAALSLIVCIFAFVTRYMAYVQVREDALRLYTPFLRLKISYRRIRSVHPVLLQQLFPPEKSTWAQRSFIEPFYGLTALVVELRGYPMDPNLLRLFLPKQMFSPRSPGFVIMVKDWMKFSTEFDSLHGAWLQNQGMRQQTGKG
ncbi:MAG: hypothetical protein IT297_06340 [Anaerolineae bacterium]|nr:hypothetical protein [Anaerolineae bacterium]MCZ7552362.1 hypothetical protein [Anaerolineales bacterium]